MKALVALGSNLGNRRAHLEAGLASLRKLGAVQASPLWMETPDESGRGPAYLNTVVLLESALSDPRPLLESLLRVELEAGRDRSLGSNAPRTLDLDLIAVEGWSGFWSWASPEDLRVLGRELHLELPHPRAHRRAFVLEPVRALGQPALLSDLFRANST